MTNHNKAPQVPLDSYRNEMVTGDNNDAERLDDFRGNTARLEDEDYTRPVTDVPYAEGNTHQLYEASQAPNKTVELANMQNRADDVELTLIEKREAELKRNVLGRVLARTELGELAARRAVIDPTGKMLDQHREFKENNLDLLMENAQAEADRRSRSTEADDGDKVA